MANKANSLAHTKWVCKYHVVFTPKYRRKVIYNQLRGSIGEILRDLCKYKGVEIIEGHLMPDHVHMLVAIPPKTFVSTFMGYLKGKSALMIFDKHANLKYKFGNRHIRVRRILCKHSRIKRRNCTEAYPGPGESRHSGGQVKCERVRRPVRPRPT